MATGQRGFSIRTKFLFVNTLLLLGCVAIYLGMATTIFRKDKTELVFDLNRSVVTNLAAELETTFLAVKDKMRLVAYFYNAQDGRNLQVLNELLAASPEIVFVAGSEDFTQLQKEFFSSSSFLETYALNKNYFNEILPQQKNIPYAQIKNQGEAIWNATTAEGPPLVGYGKSVVIENEARQPVAHYAVITYLRMDRFHKRLSRNQYQHAAIANARGEILLHQNEKNQSSGQDRDMEQLLKLALSTEVKSSVLKFKMVSEEYLGAYAKTAGSQLLVVSQVSVDSAFAVVNQFVWRSLLVALMVVNLAFIAAILFSRSLTQPMEVLVGAMRKVAQGELSTQIEVQTRDEVAELAGSFNHMIRDLRQSRQEIEEVNRGLESKVKERTLQLEKQNQAAKQAQEAMLRTTRLAAVGEIAGRAAHEVLNPLTTIVARLEKIKERFAHVGLADLSLLSHMSLHWQKEHQVGGFKQLVNDWQKPSQLNPQQSLWDEDLENLRLVEQRLSESFNDMLTDTEFLQNEAQRIGRIIHSMRSLGNTAVERTNCDFIQLCHEAANIMRDLAAQSNINIVINTVLKTAAVSVDHDEFIQALTNILRNGIQAIISRLQTTPNFAGRIELALTEKAEHFELEIRDNGCGMEEKITQQLFVKQFSTKHKREGTGIGLNISRRFLRAVDGDIELKKSVVGEGSVFIVSLPKLKNSATEAA